MGRRAFTLVELLIVVAILAIVALVYAAQPAGDTTHQKLDVAASEVASALRFARSEALRTGQPHGARIEPGSDRVRVFRLDVSGGPPVEDYSVRHPVDKKLYDLSFQTHSFAGSVGVSLSQFLFGGVGTPKQAVAFQPDGSPVSPENLTLMDSGDVDLSLSGQTRQVDVAPITGRVTLQ